jgi:hypothetical protein
MLHIDVMSAPARLPITMFMPASVFDMSTVAVFVIALPPTFLPGCPGA